MRWVCVQGLARADAANAVAYNCVFDALDKLLEVCAASRAWILGINWGELDFSEATRARLRTTYKEHNVPRFYFSANFSWKPGLKDLLTKDRRHAEKAYRDAGQIPWWADEVNAAWLVDAAEKSREPPNGHGCEQGFRRGLPADKPPMGLFFWPVDPVPGPAF